eukprot:65909_1
MFVTMPRRRPSSPTLNLPIDLRQEDPEVTFVRQQGLVTFSGDLIACGFSMLNQGRVVAAARLLFLAHKGLAGVSTYLEEAEVTKRQLQKRMEENLSEELEKEVQNRQKKLDEAEMSAKVAAAEATALSDASNPQPISPTTGREGKGKKKKIKQTHQGQCVSADDPARSYIRWDRDEDELVMSAFKQYSGTKSKLKKVAKYVSERNSRGRQLTTKQVHARYVVLAKIEKMKSKRSKPE